MSRRNLVEQSLQQAVARYLTMALKPPVFWTAFPAGGGGKIRGQILKGMGLKAGVADLIIFASGMTAWIECKSAKGRQSPEQAEFQYAMLELGHRYRVCRSLADVETFLIDIGVPLHARLAA